MTTMEFLGGLTAFTFLPIIFIAEYLLKEKYPNLFKEDE